MAIEKEVPESKPPPTFLFDSDASSVASTATCLNARGRFEKMVRKVQIWVFKAIEIADCGVDVWLRPGGDGGIYRVIQDGHVWENAGVHVSVVYGVMPLDVYRATKGFVFKDIGAF